jgi:hypothetical protein
MRTLANIPSPAQDTDVMDVDGTSQQGIWHPAAECYFCRSDRVSPRDGSRRRLLLDGQGVQPVAGPGLGNRRMSSRLRAAAIPAPRSEPLVEAGFRNRNRASASSARSRVRRP